MKGLSPRGLLKLLLYCCLSWLGNSYWHYTLEVGVIFSLCSKHSVNHISFHLFSLNFVQVHHLVLRVILRSTGISTVCSH